MPATGQATQFGDFIVRRGMPVDADAVFRLLPRRPTVAHELKDGCWQADRREACAAPYIVLNSRTHLNWLTVDIDVRTTIDAFLDRVDTLGLPMPAFVVQNGIPRDDAEPVVGRLHATWLLSTPVQRGERGRSRPQAFANRILRALTRALGGDPGFTNTLVKNPLATGTNAKPTRTTWLGGRAVDLFELADRLDLSDPPRRRAADRGLGRNVTLFDATRAYAYAIVDAMREKARKPAFAAAVQAHATGLNLDTPRPLGAREVQTVVDSVVDWTWLHYRGRTKKAGTSADGRRHAGKRRLVGRRDGVLALVLRKARLGEIFTPESLAAETQIPLRTIQRYMVLFRRLLERIATSAPRIHPSGSAAALPPPAEGGVIGAGEAARLLDALPGRRKPGGTS